MTSSDFDALAFYVCPTCKDKLETSGDALCCGACQATYLLVAGIPDFLREDAERAGGREAPSMAELFRQMDVLMDVRQGLLLDVACGPGTWGRWLASPTMEVYGIDISWSMLRHGMQLVEKQHITHMNFAHARVEALPFNRRSA